MVVERAVPDAVADPQSDPANDAASDADLITALIAGSPMALEALYDRHADAVHGAARRLSRDPSMAEDIVQETFLALWNRAEQFDASRGSVAAWLLTIARNRAVDHLRAAGRHHRAAAFSSLTPDAATADSLVEWLAAAGRIVAAGGAGADPEAALLRNDDRSRLVAALALLAPVERCVVALAYMSGLSQSEISARLGWPLGTVKTRTKRALRHLRDRLEESSGMNPAQPAAANTARDLSHVAPVSGRSGTWMCQ